MNMFGDLCHHAKLAKFCQKYIKYVAPFLGVINKTLFLLLRFLRQMNRITQNLLEQQPLQCTFSAKVCTMHDKLNNE